ncbi:MAG: glycyl-radical enzyme activating protein [Oscillospiraceae bacterium]|nr:glycyl-radical enzyme activating protein [Oscillospiraceae bacterium]
MQGCVFSIEEFSVYDGPGIRSSIFLKGCPLRCSWCHNPEGQRSTAEIVRSPNGCIGCGNCINSAEKKNGETVFTLESIKNCPKGLLRVCGEWMESGALCEKILKNRKLLKNGGVTFSGGEPLMQSSFLFECLAGLKGQLHTAIQTCGFCGEDVFEKALLSADFFLFDLKLADGAQHKRYTGVSNEVILTNFSKLAQSGKDFVVRIPLIPTVTDTAENTEGIVKILKENGVSYAELLPYNKMAGGKYKMLGREYRPDFDEGMTVNIPKEIFDKNGIAFKVL